MTDFFALALDIVRSAQPKPTPKIVTDYWPKPIPLRCFDWSAVEDGYEPPMPIGYGATEAEAIADLMAQIEERDG